VKLQCWESVIKLLDDICETAVQLSVHTLYRYGGYCCMWHGENWDIFSLEKIGSSYALYLTFIELHHFLKFHGLLI